MGKATLGGGCFWCTEAIFQNVKGVLKVESGYAGGCTDHPTYREVCEGQTGHAEVVQLEYDPEQITYPELLHIFFMTHDPTTLNRQGYDIGIQYRSVIFYHSEEQYQQAELVKKQMEDDEIYTQPILTEISPLEKFFRAEESHQNYFINNPLQAYCAQVISPKLLKFSKRFPDLYIQI